jgi:hypothetical protein
MWTDADCPQKCGQMWTINVDSTKTHSMQRAMVQYNTGYGMVHLWSGKRVQYFESIKLALLSVWMMGQELNFWTLQTDADKRCGQMWTVRNNAEKCRQNAEKCGQTADMWEWKCFDIERLFLLTYAYLRMIFTIFFSCSKVHTVHSTYKVRTCTFLINLSCNWWSICSNNEESICINNWEFTVSKCK